MEKDLLHHSDNSNAAGCYKDDFCHYLNKFLFRKPWNFILILIVSFLSYGSFLFTKTINNDANAFIYSDPLSVIEQGRWGQTILALFGIADRDVFLWSDCLGLLLLIFACLLFSFLWHCISRGTIFYGSQLVFVLLFISYPLSFEEFVYPTFLLKCGLAYCFIALCSTIIWFYHSKLTLRKSIVCVFLLSMAFSIYEAFVFVFITQILLILWYLCVTQNDFEFSKYRKNIVLAVAFLIAALIFRLLINFSWNLLDLGHVSYQPGGGPAKGILWLNNNPIDTFAGLCIGIFRSYIYPVLGYFAIFVFWGSASIFFLRSCKGERRWKTLLLCFFIACTLFAFSFLQGYAQPYRICQAFPVFIAFTGMFVYSSFKKFSYVAVAAFAFVILLQTKELCIQQNYDVEVSERGIHDMLVLERDLCQIENIEEKKIVCYGAPKRSFDVKKSMAHPLFHDIYPGCQFTQHAGMSRFDSSWQFREVFKYYCNLQIRHASKEEECVFEKAEMPRYPQAGYIMVSGDTVYVKLGEKEYPGGEVSGLRKKLRQLKRKILGQ